MNLKSVEEKKKIVYSLKLSLGIIDDSKSLFANIVRIPWVSPDEKVLHFTRMELSLFRGENASPLILSL